MYMYMCVYVYGVYVYGMYVHMVHVHGHVYKYVDMDLYINVPSMYMSLCMYMCRYM